MCYYKSTDSLLSFGISDLNKILRRENLALWRLESQMKPDSGDHIKIPSFKWTSRNKWTGTEKKEAEVGIFIRRGQEGLYLEIRYSLLRQDREDKKVLRYDLVRRESNLKPGTFRYYFADPYSPGGLCSRLYLLPDLWEFVPRSVLKRYGVLYAQQRAGHKERYFGGGKRPPENIRYRKKHYRGKETPFWRRYQELVEEDNYKWGLLLIGEWGNLTPGLPESAEDLRREYWRICGRKSSTLGRKVRRNG